MEWRIKRLNEELKKHDRKLFCYRTCNGMVQVWRKGDVHAWDFFLDDKPSGDKLQFILPITNNWTLTGAPTEWGIEPLMQRIMSMDNWNHPELYNEHASKRAENDRLEEKRKKGVIHDIAVDIQKDFAKATDDVRTANL